MRVAVRHLEVFQHLALVPDVVPGRDHVNAEIEELLSQWRRDAEPRCGVLSVGDDQVGGELLHQLSQTVLDDVPPRSAEDVTNKEDSHVLPLSHSLHTIASRKTKAFSRAALKAQDWP